MENRVGLKDILQIDGAIIAGSLFFLGIFLTGSGERHSILVGPLVAAIIIPFSLSAVGVLYNKENFARLVTIFGISLLIGIMIYWMTLGILTP